jgi:nucleotide-binding universal stress UspA family protein
MAPSRGKSEIVFFGPTIALRSLANVIYSPSIDATAMVHQRLAMERVTMNAKKVVFATDFSVASHEAFRLANTLAKEWGARIILVHVQEPALAYGAGEFALGDFEPSAEVLKPLLDEFKSDVPCEKRVLIGDPAETVVRVAKEENADIIVVGSHGRTGLVRLLMGSVAETIVRRAPCPVLVHKHVERAVAESRSVEEVKNSQVPPVVIPVM